MTIALFFLHLPPIFPPSPAPPWHPPFWAVKTPSPQPPLDWKGSSGGEESEVTTVGESANPEVLKFESPLKEGVEVNQWEPVGVTAVFKLSDPSRSLRLSLRFSDFRYCLFHMNVPAEYNTGPPRLHYPPHFFPHPPLQSHLWPSPDYAHPQHHYQFHCPFRSLK